MATNCCVFKAKVTCIISIDSKLSLQVDGATLKHLGMQSRSDLIVLLWLLVSVFMALLLVSRTFSANTSTLCKTIQVKNLKLR